jgi:hypothetical protein
MSKDLNLSLGSLKPRTLLDSLSSLSGRFQQVRRFSFLIFVVFVALLYGFVLLRINSLGNEQPSPDAITTQVTAAKVPHITPVDPTVIQQLQSLQDNSVSVQTLFDQARNNPFQ